MNIKAALIDLDDTLCNTKYVYSTVYGKCADVFRSHTGINISDKEFEKLYQQAKTEIQQQVVSSSAGASRALYFQRLVENMSMTLDLDLVNKLYTTYNNHVYENIDLYPGAKELLEYLKRTGRKIAIISDGSIHFRIGKIQALGITNYVDQLVTSQESGANKPAPQSYLLALQKLHLTTNEVIMLGNNADRDIYGANKLGMTSIRVKAGRVPGDAPDRPEEYPSYEVENLVDIIEIIKYLEGDIN
jgi:putative hydrolase of the HAD superfamily